MKGNTTGFSQETKRRETRTETRDWWRDCDNFIVDRQNAFSRFHVCGGRQVLEDFVSFILSRLYRHVVCRDRWVACVDITCGGRHRGLIWVRTKVWRWTSPLEANSTAVSQKEVRGALPLGSYGNLGHHDIMPIVILAYTRFVCGIDAPKSFPMPAVGSRPPRPRRRVSLLSPNLVARISRGHFKIAISLSSAVLPPGRQSYPRQPV